MTSGRQASGKTLVVDAREVVEQCPAMGLRLAERRVTRFLDARLRDLGTSAAQFALMSQIAASPDDTIGGLAVRLGLDPSTLSRNLQGLERAGLAEIAAVERDQRRRAVWLTEKGARLLERAMPVWRRARRELSRALDVVAIRRVVAATREVAPDA